MLVLFLAKINTWDTSSSVFLLPNIMDEKVCAIKIGRLVNWALFDSTC